jgi:hypothetical protein
MKKVWVVLRCSKMNQTVGKKSKPKSSAFPFKTTSTNMLNPVEPIENELREEKNFLSNCGYTAYMTF